MRNLIIRNVVVAAVLGGTGGVLLHLLLGGVLLHHLLGRGGGRTALHARLMRPAETDNSLGPPLLR